MACHYQLPINLYIRTGKAEGRARGRSRPKTGRASLRSGRASPTARPITSLVLVETESRPGLDYVHVQTDYQLDASYLGLRGVTGEVRTRSVDRALTSSLQDSVRTRS